MHNHWFTIRNYWQAVSGRAIGARITQAFTAEKKRCTIILLREDTRYRVDFSGQSELPYLVLKDRLAIPRRKVQVFGNLQGKTIEEVSMVPGDRVLEWRFTDASRLYFEFFGGRPNMYHTDSANRILSLFKEYDSPEVLDFRDFSEIPYPLPADLEGGIRRRLKDYSRKTLRKALVQILPHWITDFSREVLYRCSLDESLYVPDLPEEKHPALAEAIRQLYSELEEPDAYISEGPQPEFSLIKFTFDNADRWDKRLEIEEAYGRFIGIFYRGKALREQLSQLRTRVGNRIERTQRRIEKQEADLANWDPPETYRKYGDLLMANAYQIADGSTETELEDIIGDEETVTIQLNPELSAIENAQQYYEKAKKSDHGRQQLEEQIEQSRKELARLQSYFDDLKAQPTLDRLEEIREELEALGISTASRQSDQEPEKRVPYTEYVSPDGWRILVGRTARDNDELTFHIAHKEDFWFHAENVPGSHVIAEADNKHLDNPPPRTLEMAAALAAGYSQAQHSSVVPVVYTKRKYVTKPRDAGPGQVRYQFEESVIVEPRRS